MQKDIKQIIEYIDTWLLKNRMEFLTPPEANDLLEKAGLLKDRKERVGIELRKLLRAGLIPHAYKSEGRWVIPCSRNQSQIKEHVSNHESTYNNLLITDFDDETFMDYKSFKRVSDLSKEDIPISTGFYAITVDNENCLPETFSDELKERNHKLLYIGITEKSLRTRLWESELHCKKPATFFRSIGAILGFTPEPYSLGSNGKNYVFSTNDHMLIEQWMSEHLLVNFISFSTNLEVVEKQLIAKYKPIINVKDNPYKMPELVELRKKCITIGRSGYGIL